MQTQLRENKKESCAWQENLADLSCEGYCGVIDVHSQTGLHFSCWLTHYGNEKKRFWRPQPRIWSCVTQDVESLRSLTSCGGTVCRVQLVCGPTSTWCGLLYVFTAKKPWFAGLVWKCVLERGIGDCRWSVAWAWGPLLASTGCCLCCWSDGGKPEVLAWWEPRGSPRNTSDTPLSSPFQNSSVLSSSHVTRGRVYIKLSPFWSMPCSRPSFP